MSVAANNEQNVMSTSRIPSIDNRDPDWETLANSATVDDVNLHRRPFLNFDNVGTIAGTIVFAAGLFLLVMWAGTRTSFERCSAVADAGERAECYESLRKKEMEQAPAKGATAPAALLNAGDNR